MICDKENCPLTGKPCEKPLPVGMLNTPRRHWSPASVRRACIEYSLFTRGSNAEYEKMLDFVNRAEPCLTNLYAVAKYIQKHSKEQTVSSIMFILENNCVVTTFEMDEAEKGQEHERSKNL